MEYGNLFQEVKIRKVTNILDKVLCPIELRKIDGKKVVGNLIPSNNHTL